MWSQFKSIWAHSLAKVSVQYNKENLDSDIRIVLRGMKESLRPNIMRSADKYIRMVLNDVLVWIILTFALLLMKQRELIRKMGPPQKLVTVTKFCGGPIFCHFSWEHADQKVPTLILGKKPKRELCEDEMEEEELDFETVSEQEVEEVEKQKWSPCAKVK